MRDDSRQDNVVLTVTTVMLWIIMRWII